MRTLPLALALVLLAATPAGVSAQGSERESFDDSASGMMWGLGLFEMGVIASMIAMPASDCDGSECGVIAVVGMSTSLLLAIGGGLMAAASDAPSDVPLVFHHTLWPGVAALSLTVGLKEDFDSGADEPVLLVGVPTAVALASGVYTYIRRDDMLRNPGAAPGTHFATWAPWSIGLLVALVVALVADDEEVVAPIAGALMGIAAYGLGVAMIESER